MQTKLEDTIEVIGQGIDELGLDKNNPEDKETLDNVNLFIETAQNGYSLVEWPESQTYMEEEWFQEEAILGESSSYFIPIRRIIG
jgi:hypothetical protein